MFPSKTHYTLREGFDLLGPPLCGEWTGDEASAKYPEIGDYTIRTLSSYLANSGSGGNVTDFPADMATSNVSEPATKTGLPDIPVPSLNTLLRYAKLADEQGKGVIEVMRGHSPGDQQRAIHSRERPAFGGTSRRRASFEPAPLSPLVMAMDDEARFSFLCHGALNDAAGLIKNGHPLSLEQNVLIAGFGNYIKEQAKLAEAHNRQTKIETEIIQAAGAGEIPLEVFDAEVGSLTPIPAQVCLANGFFLHVAPNRASSPGQFWPDDGVKPGLAASTARTAWPVWST